MAYKLKTTALECHLTPMHTVLPQLHVGSYKGRSQVFLLPRSTSLALAYIYGHQRSAWILRCNLLIRFVYQPQDTGYIIFSVHMRKLRAKISKVTNTEQGQG